MATHTHDLRQCATTGSEAGNASANGFVSALFAVSSLEDIAAVIARQAEGAFRARNARLAWNSLPEDGAAEATVPFPGWRRMAVELGAPGVAHRAVLIAEWLADDCVPNLDRPDWRDFKVLAGARLASALELAEQRIAAQHLEKNATLQSALFTIADLASSELEMPDMLARVHGVVGELMYAKNFFIALYDAARDSVRFIYFADEHDTTYRFGGGFSCRGDPPQPYTGSHPAWPTGDGAFRAAAEEFGLDYRIRRYGPDSADWLGVPMVADGEVRGAIVVQSYDRAGVSTRRTARCWPSSRNTFSLPGAQAGARRARASRRGAYARTHQEVRERQRGEKLQKALYSIADLASSELDMGEMLQRIHAVVGELMYAKNFYIALYNAEDETVRFPYRADEKDPGLVRPDEEIPAETLRNSLTWASSGMGARRWGPRAKWRNCFRCRAASAWVPRRKTSSASRWSGRARCAASS